MATWVPNPVYAPPPTDSGPTVPLFGVQPPERYVTQAVPPTPTVTTLIGGSGQTPGNLTIFAMVIKNVGGADRIYLNCGTVIYTFTLAGTLVGTTALPFSAAFAGLFAVDDSGNFYVVPRTQADHLYKIAPSGTLLWNVNPGCGSLLGLAWQGSGSSFTLLASGASTTTTSVVLSTSGTLTGSSTILGQYCCADPTNGGLLTTWGGYLYFWDSSGAVVQYFGGPTSFVYDGPNNGVVSPVLALGSDGAIYGTGFGGLRVYTHDGFPVGGQPPGGSFGTTTAYAPLQIYNETVYLVTAGGAQVRSVPFADVAAALRAPSDPYGSDPNRPSLGPEAFLTTPKTANYFPPGQMPSAQLTLDPWWTMHHADTTLSVLVRERSQITAGVSVPAQTLSIPASAPPSGPIVLPISLPSPSPGFYVVQVAAIQNGTVRSADVLYYGVGAPGNSLDMDALPPGAAFVETSGTRAVTLAAALGVGLVRLQMTMSDLLSSASSTAPLDFSAYDAPFAAAAARAQQLGVTLLVQVGQGGTVETGLVQNGRWQARMQELASHYAGTITNWEAWNEPNIGGWSALNYTTQILIPFYNGIKAGNPSATVVGGTVIGNDVPYWQTIGQQGGFSHMDVIAFHPYTGYNRSWEEDGWLDALPALQAIWTQYGPGLPVWVTEIAWCGDNPYNLLVQADIVTRFMLHSRALGISKVAYWLLEGGFAWGQSRPLIQYSHPRDPYHIKPSGLAMMVYAQQVGALPFIAALATAIPHAYAYLFGPDAQGRNVLALWADSLSVDVTVATSSDPDGLVPMTEALGAQSVLAPHEGACRLSIDGSPRYLSVDAGSTPVVAAQTAFAPNVALSSAATTVAATSSNPSTNLSLLTDGHTHAVIGTPFPRCGVWASGVGDAQPSVTLTLGRPMSVDRVTLSGHSNDGGMVGLRDVDLYGQDISGRWALLDAARNLFYQHRPLRSFAAHNVLALRVVRRGVNYGGFGGGAPPWFWGLPSSVTDAANQNYGPLALYQIEAYGVPYLIPAPPWSGPALPSGYAYGQRLIVVGGSDAVSGSRTTPVTLAASAAQQDYVVSIHITGTSAAAIYDNLHDQAGGTDLGLFWWTGSAWSQIDYQPDTTSYGPWGAATISLRFRLQAPLGAAGATDASYLLAWGNPSPTVMRNPANIYPFFDDFVGSALGSAWIATGVSGDLSVANSLASVRPASVHGVNMQSQQTYGPGFALLARARLPAADTGFIHPEVGFRAPTGGLPAAGFDLTLGGGGGLRLHAVTGTGNAYAPAAVAAADAQWHCIQLWRDVAGDVYGQVDGSSGSFSPASSYLVPGALPLCFGIYTDGADAQYVMDLDWLAVCPAIASAPTFSLASS